MRGDFSRKYKKMSLPKFGKKIKGKMKIIWVGKNYANHAKEMEESSTELLFFLNDSAILLKKHPFQNLDFNGIHTIGASDCG